MQVLYSARNLLGHYPAVTGAPARFILRIGWAATVATGAGVPSDNNFRGNTKSLPPRQTTPRPLSTNDVVGPPFEADRLAFVAYEAFVPQLTWLCTFSKE